MMLNKVHGPRSAC